MKKKEKKKKKKTVLYESGAKKHYIGSEVDFKEWLERTEKKLKNK